MHEEDADSNELLSLSWLKENDWVQIHHAHT